MIPSYKVQRSGETQSACWVYEMATLGSALPPGKRAETLTQSLGIYFCVASTLFFILFSDQALHVPLWGWRTSVLNSVKLSLLSCPEHCANWHTARGDWLPMLL